MAGKSGARRVFPPRVEGALVSVILDPYHFGRKKNLIAKEEYYKTIEGLKTAARDPSSKSRHGRAHIATGHGVRDISPSSVKRVMVYQCHLTKFVILRPLTSKRAAEVAFQLLDIFLLFGAPTIFQSDNGSELIAYVITELKDLWPDLIMVHGKPRHPQSQGSLEHANGDIKDQQHTGLRLLRDFRQKMICLPLFQNQQKMKCQLTPRLKQTLQHQPTLLTLHQTLQHQLTLRSLHQFLHQSTLIRLHQTKHHQPTPLSLHQTLQHQPALLRLHSQQSNNVAIPIPLVDRGREDARNIGVIVDRDENDLYNIAVKSGIIKTKYSSNQLDLCP
ncbi:uncharacterized protein LOC135218047 [Macrobrachium nipponense]|uniref:uncharacterized protein LOC135218047 n=1 Tax=Macrobrachium nipponense TaxID=159736 RepID=UPI0030C84336